MIVLMISLLAATPKNAPPDCKRIQQGEGSQQELNFCAGDAWHRADADLNRAWVRVKAIMRKKDAEGDSSCYPAEPNNGPKCLGYEEALVKAQRAWLSFRDAECVVGGYANRGSDMEPMLVFQCREYLTRKRIKELNDTIDDFTRDHWQ